MPKLPTPSISFINAGVYNNSGTNAAEVLFQWDFPTFQYFDASVTFSCEYKLHSASSWTASTESLTSKLITALSNSTSYDFRVKATASGFTDSDYAYGSASTGLATTTASSIVAHASCGAANSYAPGAIDVSWLPAGVRYTQTRVSVTPTGGSATTFDSAPLINSMQITGLTVGLTYTVTVTPIAVVWNGSTQTTVVSTNPISTSIVVGSVSPAWFGPDALYLDKDHFGGAYWTLYAVGTILIGQSQFTCPSVPLATPEAPPLGTGTDAVYVTGTPANEGIFRGTVLGFVQDPSTHVVTPVSKDVTIAVSGPTCVGWLNSDPTRTDLQLDLRKRTLQSFATPGDNGGIDLRMTIGEGRRFHFLERDAAGLVIAPELTAFTFIARAKNRPDGAPLFLVRLQNVALSTFTADAGTDTLTATAAHGLAVGDRVRFTSDTTLPAPLAPDTDYYVAAVGSETTLQVSATPTGSVLDLTDAGTGTHTLYRWDIGTQSINGYDVPVFTVTPDPAAPILSRLLRQLNSSPAAGQDAAAFSIACDAEIVVSHSLGSTITSHAFTLTLDQDLAA